MFLSSVFQALVWETLNTILYFPVVSFMCEYEYENGGKCQREALEGSEKGYCLLHEDWGKKAEEETREQFYKEIEDGENNFDGCILPGFDLSEREVGLYISFQRATIEGETRFNDATIEGDAWFSFKNISALTFENAQFKYLEAQENACREAKIVNERRGDRELADYHFYREMEAKRKQKHPVTRTLEWPVQYIFGYGVYPLKTIVSWFSIVLGISPFVYWIFGGVKGAETSGQCYYFSIVTATTLGYGDYQPKPGFFRSLASVEAIFVLELSCGQHLLPYLPGSL